MSANHYRTLGVTPAADESTIRRAYLDLVRKHHPDQPGGTSNQLQAVNAAYEVLRDPERRAEYDRSLSGLLQADFSRAPFRRRVRGGLLGPLVVLALAAGTLWLARKLMVHPQAPTVAKPARSSAHSPEPEEPPLRPPSDRSTETLAAQQRVN